MALNTLRLEIDTAATAERMNAFVAQLSALPKEVAERVGDMFLRLVEGGALHVAEASRSATSSAGDGVVRLRIGGLDELIATALRAGKPDFVSHGDSP